MFDEFSSGILTTAPRLASPQRAPAAAPCAHRPWRWLAPVALLALPLACAGPRSDPAFAPHENLLSVLADFERFATLDLYRFDAPLEPSGMNLFRATLVRLANYERLYPDRFQDVLCYARGQAYERLGDYGAAADEFELALKLKSDLAPEAAEALAINRRFEALITPSLSAPSLGEYLALLEARRDGFVALADQYTSGARRVVYGALARREAERAEVELAEARWRHRDLLADGVAQALAAWEALLKRHADSARIEQWRLRAGDCYYELARGYAQERDPQGADFDWEAFERMARAALAHYRAGERAYGRPERLEAAAKVEAINAFVNRVRDQSR